MWLGLAGTLFLLISGSRSKLGPSSFFLSEILSVFPHQVHGGCGGQKIEMVISWKKCCVRLLSLLVGFQP